MKRFNREPKIPEMNNFNIFTNATFTFVDNCISLSLSVSISVPVSLCLSLSVSVCLFLSPPPAPSLFPTLLVLELRAVKSPESHMMVYEDN